MAAHFAASLLEERSRLGGNLVARQILYKLILYPRRCCDFSERNESQPEAEGFT